MLVTFSFTAGFQHSLPSGLEVWYNRRIYILTGGLNPTSSMPYITQYRIQVVQLLPFCIPYKSAEMQGMSGVQSRNTERVVNPCNPSAIADVRARGVTVDRCTPCPANARNSAAYSLLLQPTPTNTDADRTQPFQVPRKLQALTSALAQRSSDTDKKG